MEQRNLKTTVICTGVIFCVVIYQFTLSAGGLYETKNDCVVCVMLSDK